MSWNKLNHQEAVSRIVQISKKTDIKVEQARKQLFDVLDMTDEREYDNVINWVVSSYEKAGWHHEKQRLQIMSPLIASYVKWEIGHRKKEKITTNAWKVTLIREKDSTWKYKVYRYQVRQWGYPKHIRNEYAKQIKWKIDWVKITDSKWKEYPENKKFTAWELVYIKAPITVVENIDVDTKEKIKIQEDYIEKQNKTRKETLEKFNKEHPMWKDVEISFWIPVDKYEHFEATLDSITTNQTLDPKKYEVVILFNRPNNNTEFDKKTKEKILKFKLEHPEYNIHLFEHTFNFPEGKSVNMWEIYKLLWDTIIYRNTQRKNIQWMDMKKIRNLIVKRWASDSTEKHPDYLKHQLEKYSSNYWGKELVRLAWESRIPRDLALTYPLIEIDEFFQRYYDLEYVHGNPLKRDVWLWSCKAWCYCAVWGTNAVKVKEDTSFVWKVREYVEWNNENICMYYDKDFIWAVDNSTDRWIYSIVKWIPYCNRYAAWKFDKADETKKIEWNNWAMKNKGKPETQWLELTTKNLERDLSAFYQQRLRKAIEWSKAYKTYLESPEWQWSDIITRHKRALKNVVNPIMEKVLHKPDFMWLNSWDYTLCVNIDSEKWVVPTIKFNESAITKIKAAQRKRLADWYYDYRK